VQTTSQAFTEIALRRSEEVRHGREPDGARDHLWIPDTDANIGRTGPWSLAIASMAPPPIGSRAAKPEGTPSAGLAAARQAQRRLDTLARLKTGGLNGC
jgi:hypothetical protein